MLNSKRSEIPIFLIIASAVVIRIVWSLFIANEYWGDAYHNLWIIEEHEYYDKYFDYKDRHLVWLPLYRWLSIAFNYLIINPFFKGAKLDVLPLLPLILQIIYVLVSSNWILKNVKSNAQKRALLFTLFLPMPILFSAYNMSESLSLILITVLIISVIKELSPIRVAIIVIVAASIALTRHESTAFLGILTTLLFLNGQRTKSMIIVFGVLVGLIIWSIYNYLTIGEALFWLTSKFVASGTGAKLSIQSGGVVNRFFQSFTSILLAFPFLVLLPIKKNYKFNREQIFDDQSDETFELIVKSLYIYLLIFVTASFFFFHGADVKYMINLSFVFSILATFYLRDLSISIRSAVSICMILLVIPIYMLIFYGRSFNLELKRQMGQELSQLEPMNGFIWNDYPVSLAYSNLSPGEIVSSGYITKFLDSNEGVDMENAISHFEIEYIVFADYDMSRVLELIPDIEVRDSVFVGSYLITNVKSIEPPQMKTFQLGGNLFNQIKYLSLSLNQPISLLKVEQFARED